MVRFIQQKNNNDCAPIAVLNVLRWAGLPYDYSDRHEIYEACKFCPTEGTYISNLTKALRAYGIRVSFRKKATIPQISAHLAQQGIVIVNTRLETEGDYHVFLVVSRSLKSESFEVVNYSKKFIDSKELRSNINKGGALWFVHEKS